ncbi:AraC family transcriptional regulator [Vibrio algarum]|uniref:AraC family transcriptional regulator n=1 Tax=Vibrio algarum TaxID=3020714 RepID=A0ABT4YWD3_9VIBR|nr:AraC family transcriptional regulator [Vibrio sp. KJ40-1]MDB1125876.1 AraC family transcriptional regulator [Vibrio sp. KJ40-1]
MTTTYRLSSHLLHSNIPFCIQPAIHDGAFHLHRHDFSELMIVLSGQAEHIVGKQRSTIKTGDVFVINGTVEHGFSNANELMIFNLMFDERKPFFETPAIRVLPGYQALFNIDPLAREQESSVPYLNIQGDILAHVERLLKEIYTEYNEAKLGFESVLTAMLQHLAVLLVRNYPEQANAKQKNTLALARALSFIEQHYYDPSLRANDIATRSFLSTRQLERLFHQFFQTTPSQYLNDKRISRAKELLASDINLNINQIAENCGFNDSNYFSRVFRKQTELSPREYRKLQFVITR